MVNQAGHDPARSLLTLATRQLPAERRGWGQAMAAELDQLQHSPSSPVVEGRLEVLWNLLVFTCPGHWRARCARPAGSNALRDDARVSW